VIHVSLALAIIGAGRFDSQRREIDHIRLECRRWMAARNDYRAMRQRQRLSDRYHGNTSDSRFAGLAGRGNTGDGTGDSAARLSVWRAAGVVPPERVGDNRANLAGATGQSVGVEIGESADGR